MSMYHCDNENIEFFKNFVESDFIQDMSLLPWVSYINLIIRISAGKYGSPLFSKLLTGMPLFDERG